jgi:hypothetical protein
VVKRMGRRRGEAAAQVVERRRWRSVRGGAVRGEGAESRGKDGAPPARVRRWGRGSTGNRGGVWAAK